MTAAEVFQKCAEIVKHQADSTGVLSSFEQGRFEMANRIMKLIQQAAAEHEASMQGAELKEPLTDEELKRKKDWMYACLNYEKHKQNFRLLTRAEFNGWYRVHHGKFKDAEGFWESFWFTFKGKVIA